MITIKTIDLKNIPKKGKLYDWINSINKDVKFNYNDIIGHVKISGYNKNSNSLTVLYKNELYNIRTGEFTRCNLGNILKVKTSEFKCKIGQRIIDYNEDGSIKRDLTIIDMKKFKNKKGQYDKYYKYKCNICNFDGGVNWNIKNKEYRDECWILERDIINKKVGCSCCCSSPQIVIEDINSIYKTDKWMIPIINDDEFCKTHTHSSNEKVKVTCPYCGRTKNKLMAPNNIHKYKKVKCICGDGIKYPNKFMFNLLEQLKLDFKSEYSPEWILPKSYDFYIPSINLIIEMDGGWHNTYNNLSGQTAEQSKMIDNYKDKQANINGIEVIRIDCDYGSNDRFEYIKNNILNNGELNIMFDLSKIDLNKCNEFACSNLVKMACEYKNNNPEMTIREIANIIGFSCTTVSRWLKIGNKVGWHNPSSKERISYS